uniref:Coat protein n=20 Tax=Raspberry bushy dwarf virus TaxID=12451 RepID=A0A8F8MZM7_RBDV|nr:coat protein [Raspberry bushy dwarf virus]
MSKKAVPPIVKAQYELYNRKLNRAIKVSGNQKKLDASFVGFSEGSNPATGKPHADMSMSAKVSRVNTWLKNFDREYWDTQFASKPVPRPAKQVLKGSSSKSQQRDEGEVVFTRKDSQKSVRTVSYWVCTPEKSMKPLKYKEDENVVEVTFNDLTAQKAGDKLVSILLEINVVGGAVDDKGRVAVLEKDAAVTVDYLLGSPYEAINLVSGLNKINFRSMTDVVDSIPSLLNERKVCVFQNDDSSSFYIRKWANFLQEVSAVLPVGTGKSSTIVLT